MKKLMSNICALAMLASVGFPATAYAGAVPAPKVAPTYESSLVEVQRDRWDRRDRRHWRGDRSHRQHQRWHGRHADRPGYYRGHRGYRYHRPGYRRHGDFWFPPAAFITGAIVGGALSSPSTGVRVRDYGSSHVQWCTDRYRSYRPSDNTFQPYNGPRRACRSPYY